jgi:hypothetical protein
LNNRQESGWKQTRVLRLYYSVMDVPNAGEPAPPTDYSKDVGSPYTVFRLQPERERSRDTNFGPAVIDLVILAQNANETLLVSCSDGDGLVRSRRGGATS